MIVNAPKVFHQSIKFIQRRSARSLDSFSDEPQLFENRDGVFELLARERG